MIRFMTAFALCIASLTPSAATFCLHHESAHVELMGLCHAENHGRHELSGPSSEGLPSIGMESVSHRALDLDLSARHEKPVQPAPGPSAGTNRICAEETPSQGLETALVQPGEPPDPGLSSILLI